MFVALGVVLTPTTARASPVNAEVLRPNLFREGWSGGVRSGNSAGTRSGKSAVSSDPDRR
jgi:hypothetical protein